MKKYFQPAKQQSAAWNVAKTLLQSAVFWMIFLWLIPVAIHRLEVEFIDEHSSASGNLQEVLGWLLFSLGGLLGLYSGITLAVQGKGTPLPLDTAQELVIRGPFQYVRNPMAVAGIAQGIAVGVILASWAVVVYSLAGAVIWHRWVRPHEEADLLDRFGEDYRQYRDTTGLWLPTKGGGHL